MLWLLGYGLKTLTFFCIGNITLMVFHYGGRLAYVYDLRAVGSWLLVWLSGFGRVARGQGFGFLRFGCAICFWLREWGCLWLDYEGMFLTAFMIPLLLLREVVLVVWA